MIYLNACSWHPFFPLGMIELMQVKMKENALLLSHPWISDGSMILLDFLLLEYFWFPNCPGLQDEGNPPCSQKIKMKIRADQKHVLEYTWYKSLLQVKHKAQHKVHT